MAGTIIADTIQATSQQISLNVGNTTILTASSTGLTLIPTTNVNINVTNSTVAFGSGNVTRPSISFSGNTSTGIFMPLANTIAFTSAGTEDIRITATGDVGIGTSSPSGKLHVESAGTNYIYTRNGSASGIAGVVFQNTTDTRAWRIDGTNLDAYDLSAGVTRMRIDASGRVTMPYQPYLRATVANGTTSINFGTTHANVTVPYNQIVENTGNHFNTSTYQFTCPVAGVYAITATIQLGNAVGTTGVGPNFGVYRSGTAITGSYHFVQSSVGYQKMECTAFVKCAANDTLYINLYTGSSMTGGQTEFNGDMRNALTIGFVG